MSNKTELKRNFVTLSIEFTGGHIGTIKIKHCNVNVEFLSLFPQVVGSFLERF